MVDNARDYPEGQPVPGTIYKVVRRIGGGGMGTVYDVEDTTIGKRYVLKALHPQLGNREDLARRMRNEARTLARLNHPNIVEVITAGVTDDELRLPYYVMERLNGQSLRVVLEKKGRLELPHACHIAIDLLDALDHAHDKGVVHRDVKPDNIFLHRTAANVTVTKLLDFGIVSILDGGNGETAGRFLGTLRYAAPEQLKGDKPTPRMDVYCAGLVLYEMIAGRGPFDELGDSTKIAAAHVEKLAPPISLFAEVPPELERLLGAALHKRPDDRPRDAYSFATSLRNLKRSFAPARGHESTENRATAPEVDARAAGAAPVVEIRQAGPGGPYVVAPQVPEVSTSMPRTTMKGMPLPTAPLNPLPLGGGPLEIDRNAPTGAAAGYTPLSLGKSPSGTEAMTQAVVRAPIMAAVVPPTLPSPPALHWPTERPDARSEEPLVVRGVGGSKTRPMLVLTLVVGALLGLSTVVALAIFVRDGSQARLRLFGVPSTPPTGPLLVPVVTVPAPTLAPPGLDEPEPSRPARARPTAPSAADTTAAAAADTGAAEPSATTPSEPPAKPPVATGAPVATASPRPAHPATPTTPAPKAAPMLDKPGPGF